jgi:hypothetical protein
MPLLIGALQRDLSILLGTGAIVPWVVLNLSAVRGPPSELFGYYAFPFLILLAWPWLVPALRQLDPHDLRPRRLALGNAAMWSTLWILAMVVYFTTPFATDSADRIARARSVQDFLPKFDRTRIQRVMKFADTFSPLLATRNVHVLMDDAMFSLLPDNGQEVNSLAKDSLPARGQPYIVAYFTSYMQAHDIESSDVASNADACFAVVGTNIRIFSSQASEELRETVGNLIEPVDCLSFSATAAFIRAHAQVRATSSK